MFFDVADQMGVHHCADKWDKSAWPDPETGAMHKSGMIDLPAHRGIRVAAATCPPGCAPSST
jgi:hypothetical protein